MKCQDLFGKRSGIVSIVLFAIVLLSQFTFAIESETLIDFRTYEKKNLINDLYYTSDEEFRKKYYNEPQTIQAKEQIKHRDAFIPWFKITPDDMKLNRWVIRFHFPISYHTPPPKLTEQALTPYYKLKGLKQFMLGTRIYFPTIAEDMSAEIHPPYEIYQFDQNGKLSSLGNGVLSNVGDIKKISMTVGFKHGQVKDILIFLKLEDYLGGVWEYPLGFLYKKKSGKTRYFKDYDGNRFTDNQEINNLDKLNTLPVYYKVYYRNDEAVLWTMVKEQREIYSEVRIQWTNSNYLPPTRKKAKRRLIYPNEIPYIKFKSITVKRQGGSSRQFYLFLKDVKIQYEKAVPDFDLTIDDDKNWEILSEVYKAKRLDMERQNANRIYLTIKAGWAKGFVKYEEFKNLFFLRFPPIIKNK